MEIKVDKELPNFESCYPFHAYDKDGIMYISQELKDLVEGSIKQVPITNKDIKKALEKDKPKKEDNSFQGWCGLIKKM